VGTTYRSLGEDGHYEILVRVRNRSEVKKENRAYELSLEDVEGSRFQFIVWESSKQGTNCDWKEGCWYRLSGVTANVWPSGTVPHGTSSLDVEYLGSQRNDRKADILYLTDSHLGKTSHSHKGSSWSVSPENGFQSAIEKAISMDIDAVVHGGDLFHNSGDGIGAEEIATCREGLVALAESGIPFYFIYGNHDRQAGRRVMDRFIDESLAEHLGPRYEAINDTVAVYGIDHQSNWMDFVPNFERASGDMRTLLFVHQSLSPFTESNNPDCSFRSLREEVDIPADLIVTGHVHTRVEEQLSESRGLSGGATARVGASRTDLHPSVELISLGDGEPSVQRKYL
jgi:exonuclease SbcD